MRKPNYVGLAILSSFFFPAGSVPQNTLLGVSTGCHCLPGDDCWPSLREWNALNNTVGGRLVATVPIGAPCHDPDYNAAVCANLQQLWTTPSLHLQSSSSVMAPFFANQSCDPWTPPSQPCLLGNYVDYAVNVTSKHDISTALKFAKEKNIRFVVRNTGHDYNGKSTGAGALSVWMHYLKDILIKHYGGPYYSGPAIKMGAGVSGYEAYIAANASGLVVVGGECPTVGISGGYTQGGGHSALSSKYGLAADQTLEWEVVLADGTFVKASRIENQDLYWALSGGGGGTFGVVWSLTAKVHKDMVTSGALLNFTNAGVSKDTFYKAITSYHSHLTTLVDAGAMATEFFTNTTFSLAPVTAPGLTASELRMYLTPFAQDLEHFGIKYDLTVKEFSGYLNDYDAMFGLIPVEIAQYGGRLVPRSVVERNNDALTTAFRDLAEDGALIIAVGLNVSAKVTGDVNNAVLPAWRDTLLDVVETSPWNATAPLPDMVKLQDKMTYDWIPQLKALTPGAGCYLNEGDFRDPDWKPAFYGSNYNKLLSIKNKYDPDHVFYAVTAVGSDYWNVDSSGRMCKA